MRKLSVVLLALLVLTGCSSSVTQVSDPDGEIISGTSTYTRQELYEAMKLSDYSSIILADLTERIARFEEVDLDEVEAEVDEYFTLLQETYGDSYESTMAILGGEESYRVTITYSYLLEALALKYCEYELENLVTEYAPVLVLMQSFDDLDDAQTMIDNINGGMTFAEACEEAGITSTPSETVYTTASDIDSQLMEWFADCEEGLVDTPVVITSESTDSDGNTTTTYRYYVIDVISTDASEFLDEFYSSIGSDIATTDIFNYFFTKYSIEVYDQDVYEYLSENYEGIN